MRSFRNLADADLELPDAGCVVVGPNGHGKTSLFEALLYGEIFRSYRGAGDRELVRFGADGFRVECTVVRSGSTVQTPQWSPGGSGQVVVAAGYDARTRAKKATVDGAEPARLADAIGIVRGVVLSPTDVRLVAGSPRERRHFLDVLLAITVRGYVQQLATYRRALRHRVRSSADVETWEHVLAESGANVARTRQAWAERWAARYGQHCVAMGESGQPELGYVTLVEGGSAHMLREALAGSREKDLARGRTSVGPHRDELRLTLDGRSLRTYGSAGQQRTAAVALRLLEAETLRELTGEPATICLDDAFAELDEVRSRCLGLLIELMAGDGAQVIAAVPREGEVPEVIGSLPRWGIRDGRIQ